MRLYMILYVLVGILSGGSFLSFGGPVKTAERLWYANRILVTIFDDTETVEDLYPDQQVSVLLESSKNFVDDFNNAQKELDNFFGGEKNVNVPYHVAQQYYQKQQETYKLQEGLNKKIKDINDQVAKIYKTMEGLKFAEGSLFVCLLKQKNVPILISQEILASVVAASKKLLKDKVAKEDKVAALLKDWYCFEVIEGVYLLIPQQDRILQKWKWIKRLEQEAPVTPAELRIGFRLDHLQLLDRNTLFEKLKGKEILKAQPEKNYELSKIFSERQARALTGDKGKSPLFVTRFDRKNVSEETYPEQSWVVIMEGHGSTYTRKNQSTVDYYNNQINRDKQAIKVEENFILGFEVNIDDFKNQKQQNEKIRNELSNFDEVLASLNNAIKITEENISASKSSIDFYNKQIKQMEEQRDQSQAQAGFISGITAEYMSQILDFFDTSIRVRFVFWDSCFSGGANAALVLQQTKQGIQKKFKFDLATGSSTEMVSFGGCSNADYEAFLGDIFKPSNMEHPVDIMQALQRIHNFYDQNDKQKLRLSNIPLYKPAGAGWVQGSSIKAIVKPADEKKKERSEEQVASFGRILAETCDSKKELNIKTFFGGKESIGGPAVLLLFAKDIKCPLLCEEKLPTFVSEVTGPAVHIFESIRAPKASVTDAVKSFLSFDSLLENKFFWVKRLELSAGKVYEAFFLNATDTVRSQRRALFIEMKNGEIVSMSEMHFEGKEIVTQPPIVKQRVDAKNFYEEKRSKIQNMEALAQLGLPHEEIEPQKIQKIKATLVAPIPSKVVESQKLYQTQLLFDDFARAMARIA